MLLTFFKNTDISVQCPQLENHTGFFQQINVLFDGFLIGI